MNRLVGNTVAIAELQALRSFRPGGTSYFGFLLSLVLLPLPVLFFAHYLAPDDPEVGPRLLAGSIIFSVGLIQLVF
jgi:hypothetical protein